MYLYDSVPNKVMILLKDFAQFTLQDVHTEETKLSKFDFDL